MQSLDSYVDHMKLGPPALAVSRHFTKHVRALTGLIDRRRTYEIMRYWDDDFPDWTAQDRDLAAAWRTQPKWVVSRSLKSVGPNATLAAGDLEKRIRRLNAERVGDIHVAGPVLAQSLSDVGLVDEYRLYLRPVVLGGRPPFFAGDRTPLHLVGSDLIADDVIRLSYVPDTGTTTGYRAHTLSAILRILPGLTRPGLRGHLIRAAHARTASCRRAPLAEEQNSRHESPDEDGSRGVHTRRRNAWPRVHGSRDDGRPVGPVTDFNARPDLNHAPCR